MRGFRGRAPNVSRILMFKERFSVDIRRFNPLQLAYMGDAVCDVYVRRRLLEGSDAGTRALHRRAVEHVRAAAQSAALARVEGMLSGAEADIVRRGRNAKTHTAPRHADPLDYSRATAFEALLGYLYLSGDRERLDDLLRAAYE